MSGDSLGYIAALDVGTTIIRCQIIDQQANCRGSSFDNVRLHYPQSDSVEINPDELWTDVIGVVKNAIINADINVTDVKSLAISTQRATFITWRRDNGKHIHNFITWKDLRAATKIEEINKSWKMMALRTGSALLHFFSRQTKFDIVSNLKFASSHVTIRLLWLLHNNEDVQEAIAENNLMFGTLETWLVYKFTGGKKYVSDISNASATGLYDPFSLCWNFIPKYFNIPLNILPPVVDNDYDFGETKASIFGIPIRIGAVMADQSASMYGSCSFKENDIKLTLGTGAFLNVNTGQHIRASSNGLYPLVGWKNKRELVYLTEVSCSDAGSLIEWMKSIGIISNPNELSSIANSTKDNGGIYFVPAFGGLGPPINNESAASGFIGIKPNTTKEHLIRAVLESIVYRTAQAYDLLNKHSCRTSGYIRVDGGVSKNDFICQLLADLTNLTVKRINLEMGTLGVAYFAGQTCGFWTSTEDILNIKRPEDVFMPTENSKSIEALRLSLDNWKKAAERFMSWYE